MRCPVCEEKTSVYCTLDHGSINERYRCCSSCGHKFKTFEEIDSAAVIRPKTVIKVVPLLNPNQVKCPDCTGDVLHTKRRETTDKIAHVFRCKNCNGQFAIETDLSDPIGKAREKAAQRGAVICPQCDGRTWVRGTYVGKQARTCRRECQDCGHRFTIQVSKQSGQGNLPAIREGQIDHRVMP